MMKKLLMTVFSSAVFVLKTTGLAQAALTVQSESVITDIDNGQVLFKIDFNQIPDFFTVDEFNRQANTFQYFIGKDDTVPVLTNFPNNLNTIIRGGEINVANDIRIRDALPLDSGGVNSGGWGQIRGSIPYKLDGTRMEFSAPLQLINDSDGLFNYNLLLTEFGASSDSVFSQSVLKDNSKSVSEPSDILGILIFGLFTVAWRRESQK